MAEVDVDVETGQVWVKRIVTAYDVGLIVNPITFRESLVEAKRRCTTVRQVTENIGGPGNPKHHEQADLRPYWQTDLGGRSSRHGGQCACSAAIA